VADVREHAKEHGVLFGSGRPDVQVILSPPLCTTEAELERAVGRMSGGDDDPAPVVALEQPDGSRVDADGNPIQGAAPRLVIPWEVHRKWAEYDK
jgi:hypothetical protein